MVFYMPNVIYLCAMSTNAFKFLYVTYFYFFIYFKINGALHANRHLLMPHVDKCISIFICQASFTYAPCSVIYILYGTFSSYTFQTFH